MSLILLKFGEKDFGRQESSSIFYVSKTYLIYTEHLIRLYSYTKSLDILTVITTDSLSRIILIYSDISESY